jgi:hypothetical protein
MVSPKDIHVHHLINRTCHCCILVTILTNAGRREIIGTGTRKRGMVLPFTPLSITFDNIKYSVIMPQVSINQKKCLIFNTETGTTK